MLTSTSHLQRNQRLSMAKSQRALMPVNSGLTAPLLVKSGTRDPVALAG